MLHVALTGNVAAGKSTVAALFRGWGAFVTDADRIVRELQQPGTPVFQAIVHRFGPEVIAADGGLDRDALRRIVLHDAAALADLNAIVHPAVRARREALAAAAEASGAPVAVHDIPLLFEAADPAEFDVVVLVDAPEALRRERLVQQRGLSVDEADRLIATQQPAWTKRDRSDFVIENDGDRAALEQAARRVWEALIARATGAGTRGTA
jgi:dephospho-CoA kinase